jgi:putative flippase GtrA
LKSAIMGLARRFERVWRYILVGAGVTLVYSLLTAAFITSLVIPEPTLASAAATIITQPFAFLVHRAVTYRDVPPDDRHWKRYAIAALSGFLLNTGIMKLATSLGWPFWVALAIGWVVIPVVNYLAGAIWVFRTARLLSVSRDPPA